MKESRGGAAAVVLVGAMVCAAADARADEMTNGGRFWGGSYDGYDTVAGSTNATVWLPFVDNANGATNVQATSAWLNGTLQSKGTGTSETVVYAYWGSTDEGTNQVAWSNQMDFGAPAVGQLLTMEATGLTAGTVYYYRFYATNATGEESWAEAAARSFGTPDVPTVTTGGGASAVGQVAATLNGTLTAGGSATITTYWGQDSNNWSASANLGVCVLGFSNRVSGLRPGAEYYYQCHATNAAGSAWSDVASFAALPQAARFGGGSHDGYERAAAGTNAEVWLPIVDNAGGATNVQSTSAWLNGRLQSPGTGTVQAAVSVYWGPTDEATNKAAWSNRQDFGDCSAGQSLTTNVTGLAAGTVYYYRFYASNALGNESWAEASARSFGTPDTPVVTTGGGATSVGQIAATLNGILTAGGSATITIYWGQDSNNWSFSANLGTCVSAFSNGVSGLRSGDLYYYRCYATNASGAAWSDVASFMTLPQAARFGGGSYDGYDRAAAGTNAEVWFPLVDNAGGATNVQATSAWLNGTLQSAGTGTVQATVSVYWGPTDESTNKAAWSNEQGFGDCSAGQALTTNVIGLTPGSIYYYRFYASNALANESWAESSARSFGTPGPPAVSTGVGATSVGQMSATLNGVLTAGGSATITVYWGQDSNDWSQSENLGAFVSAFSNTVSGLRSGVMYSYRVYATNTSGEAWSDVASFVTVPQAARFGGGSYDGYDTLAAGTNAEVWGPIVDNANGATNVQATSACLNGTLQAIGTGTVTAAVSVYWGSTDGATNKTAWSNQQDFGDCSAGQALTTNVTGLTTGTVYYYRFYASNALGNESWAEASARSFGTPGAPAVTTGIGATSVGQTAATLNGTLTAGGNATITVFWGQDSNNWTGSENLGVCVSAFSNGVSGLRSGVFYYYRCYATNTAGEDWSDIASFVTVPQAARFGGGMHDGYDRVGGSTNAEVWGPIVDNADGATNVQATSAWLNGTLQAAGTGTAQAAVSVYWGPTDEATNRTAWSNRQDFGLCNAGQSLTTNVTGLTAGTVYYYRFYASNSVGNESWAEASARSFGTPAVPVVTTGIGAAPVGQITATLNGVLTAGGSATITLYWGPNPANWAASANLGVCVSAFSNGVSGLHPGQLYYYSCYATNEAGSAWSGVSPFTTLPPAARFGGGSYDGYDSVTVLQQVKGRPGIMFVVH